MAEPADLRDLIGHLGLASPKRRNKDRIRMGEKAFMQLSDLLQPCDVPELVVDLSSPRLLDLAVLDSTPLKKLKSAELREVVVKLGSASCADALKRHGINGEALYAILERPSDRAGDMILELLPESCPMGERLIFTKRLQEHFRKEVKPLEPPKPPADSRNDLKPSGSRTGSRLLPLLILGYVGWLVLSIVTDPATDASDEPVILGPDASAMEHMYSWLGWSPEPGTACSNSMKRHFEGAMPSRAVVERVKESLVPFGMTRANTIYAEATCSDEINHEPQRLGSLFTDVWGSVFTMGGIGGFPYGGQAALGAFSGHVPDGGSMFILYGPHVGITESGEIGSVLRTGQQKCTTACGALMGVYKNCLNGLTTENYTKMDEQARFIHNALAARLDEIKSADSPEAMLPRVAFDVAHEQVMNMTSKMKLGNGYLVLLGGIQINTPDYMQDQFLPLHFSIQSQKMPQKDLRSGFDANALDKFLAANM